MKRGFPPENGLFQTEFYINCQAILIHLFNIFIYIFERKSVLFERMKIVQMMKPISKKMKGGIWWIQHDWNQHHAHQGMTAISFSFNRSSFSICEFAEFMKGCVNSIIKHCSKFSVYCFHQVDDDYSNCIQTEHNRKCILWGCNDEIEIPKIPRIYLTRLFWEILGGNDAILY